MLARVSRIHIYIPDQDLADLTGMGTAESVRVHESCPYVIMHRHGSELSLIRIEPLEPVVLLVSIC